MGLRLLGGVEGQALQSELVFVLMFTICQLISLHMIDNGDYQYRLGHPSGTEGLQ